MATISRTNVLAHKLFSLPGLTWAAVEIVIKGLRGEGNIIKFAESDAAEHGMVMRAVEMEATRNSTGEISSIINLEVLSSSSPSLFHILADKGIVRADDGTANIIAKKIGIENADNIAKAELEAGTLQKLAGVRGIPQVVFGINVASAKEEWVLMEDLGVNMTSQAVRMMSGVNPATMFVGCLEILKEMHARDMVHMNIRTDNISVKAGNCRPSFGLTGLSSALPLDPSTKLTERLTAPPPINPGLLFARKITDLRGTSLNVTVAIDAFTSIEKAHGACCGPASDVQSLALSVVDVFLGEGGMSRKVWEAEFKREKRFSVGIFGNGTEVAQKAKMGQLAILRRMVLRAANLTSTLKECLHASLMERAEGRPSVEDALTRMDTIPLPPPVVERLARSFVHKSPPRYLAVPSPLSYVRGSKRRYLAEPELAMYGFAPGSCHMDLGDESEYSDGDVDMVDSDIVSVCSSDDAESIVEAAAEESRPSKRARLNGDAQGNSSNGAPTRASSPHLAAAPIDQPSPVRAPAPDVPVEAPAPQLAIAAISLAAVNAPVPALVPVPAPVSTAVAQPLAVVPLQEAAIEVVGNVSQRRRMETLQARRRASDEYKAARPRRSVAGAGGAQDVFGAVIVRPASRNNNNINNNNSTHNRGGQRAARPVRAVTLKHPHRRVRDFGDVIGGAQAENAGRR